ncbi:MAG: uracil-DNA glycosylase [Chlorobi bacterium]|nr:uracil-DNA glycosylase [Chlorobiota bacterium]
MYLRQRKEIMDEISTCTRCKLHNTRITPVLPCGNPESRIMVIAQSPGETENRNGVMFTGPSGKLFYELLEETGIDRNDLYLTNLIKCMLPGARRPHHGEIHSCTPFLDLEAELLHPLLQVPLGFHATRYLLKKYRLPVPDRKSVKHLFGLVLRKDKTIIFPLRHPTALLFNPAKKGIMLTNYHRLHELISKMKNGQL